MPDAIASIETLTTGRGFEHDAADRVTRRDGSQAPPRCPALYQASWCWTAKLMSAIIVERYDALKEAGASDEKRAAAQALANYDSCFSKIEADLLVLKWMVGFILAGAASLVVQSFVA
jgi:hypothetical protein